MLRTARVCANVPTANLQQAGRFYEERLGLEEAHLNLTVEGGVIYQAGGGTLLHVYERPPSASDHTVATFLVEDLEAVMTELRSRGVSFEAYNSPELITVDGVFSDETGFKAAWIRDPDGNILSLEQLPPA